MFEGLSDRLDRSFKILKGQGRITEINVAESVKEIRKALIEADVSYKIAKQFTNEVKEKALGQNVLTAVKPGELMVKIVHDELAGLMGGEQVKQTAFAGGRRCVSSCCYRTVKSIGRTGRCGSLHRRGQKRSGKNR